MKNDLKMKPVVVESPYAGKDIQDVSQFEINLAYMRTCLRDCLLKQEAPFASHALYTQPGILVDEIPEDRELGIKAGFAIRELYSASIFYVDLGMSNGMTWGMKAAEELQKKNGHRIEIRTLGKNWYSEYKKILSSFPNRKIWGVD